MPTNLPTFPIWAGFVLGGNVSDSGTHPAQNGSRPDGAP